MQCWRFGRGRHSWHFWILAHLDQKMKIFWIPPGHPSAHPPVRPSVHPSVRPSVRPSSRPSGHPSTPAVRPPGRPPVRPSACPPVRPSVHPSDVTSPDCVALGFVCGELPESDLAKGSRLGVKYGRGENENPVARSAQNSYRNLEKRDRKIKISI